MKTELLSQCLTAWMGEKDVSVAELTGMVGYKSKTSVFRLLKDQCNGQTMESFVELLSPQLDEKWIKRFRRALRVEKYGLQKYQTFDSMMDFIRNPQRPEDACPPSMMPSGGENVLILGHPWKRTKPLVEQMLREGRRITHYVERKAVHTVPGLLQSMIQHIGNAGYEALMLDEKPAGAWHLMVTDAGQMFLNGKWYSVTEGRDLYSSLCPEGGIPLYRFADLHRVSDYIDFMENAYWLESGGAAIIAKQTPGIQMMPEDVVLSAFTDFVSEQIEPISAAVGSLRMILRKRIDNFSHRKKPAVVVFEQKAMEEFLRTGFTSDHFYAFRPYTPEERLRILQSLQAISRQDNMRILVADKKPRRYSMEAYENRGLLIYPGYTRYNTEMEAYRELFLPGQEFFTFFSELTEEMVLPAFEKDAGRTERWFSQAAQEIADKHS